MDTVINDTKNAINNDVPSTNSSNTATDINKKVVIKVEDVTKSFKIGKQEIQVLKGISFQINEGDFAIIIGPSGSGKSTLLHTILGLEVPTTGKVWFLGQDLYALVTEDDRSIFRKKHIGMVYQQPNWVKSLTVVENVAFPLSLMGVEKTEGLRKSWEALKDLNMIDWVNYRPSELSGGQQQKVALVRALVNNPEIIIADEPTGNLDFASGQMLMELLVSLNKKGKTIVMVTHDLEYVKYARTVVEFLDGRVVNVYDSASKDKATFAMKGKRGDIESGGGDTSIEGAIAKKIQDSSEQSGVAQNVASANVSEAVAPATATVPEPAVVTTTDQSTPAVPEVAKVEVVTQTPVSAEAVTEKPEQLTPPAEFESGKKRKSKKEKINEVVTTGTNTNA